MEADFERSGRPVLVTWKQRAKGTAGDGLLRTRLHRLLLRDRAIVLAFHRVNDSFPEDPLTTSTTDFARHCELFARHFDVVPLGEIVGRLERGLPVARLLSITLDDGYRDNFECAAPTLRRLGLPATFFVVTDFLDTDFVASWDRHHSLPPAWMSWEQVAALHSDGFEIGAHTRSHADLGRVEGEEAEREIRGSRAELERRLGRKIDLFAFPFGGVGNLLEANRERVRAAGFRCCVSCFGGTVRSGADPFRLQRVPVTPWFGSPGQLALEAALGRA